MLRRSAHVFLIVVCCAASTLASGNDAPPWLRQAAALKLPTFDKRVTSVVLVDDSTLTLDEQGQEVTVWNYAMRILAREGRGAAVAEMGYETDQGKIREFKAWLIRESGEVKSYGKNETVDQADLNDIYDESRVKRIVAKEDAETGSVFGFQVISERRPFFHQSTWFFQESAPVISCRFTLILPTGWVAKGLTFNHPNVEPTLSGTTYTWELRDLPPLQDEPASPTLMNLAPRVAVKYFPSEGTRNPGIRAFESWNDVSRWYSELSDPQATPDQRIVDKARELTASAKTELEKIRAVGRYVQNIQYISVQIGVGRWRPHAATEVMAKSYGDCKDKANLLRAMLKVLKIDSYPVLIFSGDPTFVRETWVSPGQFNHCIIAIKVSDETKAATVINHPKLGRLLIFDATDDQTPVGDLPDHEQGSYALIAAGDSGSLEKMPETMPEENNLLRAIEATLSPDGSLSATITEQSLGQLAVAYRREFRSLSRPQYVKAIENRVTQGVTAANVTTVEPVDNVDDGKFDLKIGFFGQGVCSTHAKPIAGL